MNEIEYRGLVRRMDYLEEKIKKLQSPDQEECDCEVQPCDYHSKESQEWMNAPTGKSKPLPPTSEIDKPNESPAHELMGCENTVKTESLAEKFEKFPEIYRVIEVNGDIHLDGHTSRQLADIAESHYKDRLDQAYQKGLMTAHSNSYDCGHKHAIASMKEKFESIIGKHGNGLYPINSLKLRLF